MLGLLAALELAVSRLVAVAPSSAWPSCPATIRLPRSENLAVVVGDRPYSMRLFQRAEAVEVLHLEDRAEPPGRFVEDLLRVADRRAKCSARSACGPSACWRARRPASGRAAASTGRRTDLLDAVHVRLGDDLQQRHAGAVEIDAGCGAGSSWTFLPASSSRWARRMRISCCAAGQRDLEPARRRERQVVLADLVVLGQVGVVVALAVPLGEARRSAIQGHADHDGYSTALRFITGSTPGMPRHTGQMLVLGGSPNWLRQRQNIFVSVASST